MKNVLTTLNFRKIFWNFNTLRKTEPKLNERFSKLVRRKYIMQKFWYKQFRSFFKEKKGSAASLVSL